MTAEHGSDPIDSTTSDGASIAACPWVWLVDDDQELQEMLAPYLEQQGARVTCLSSAEACQELLQEQQPDLLVLDVMLPGLDGLSLLRRLRDQGIGVPVLMLTAKGDPVDRIIGLEQGADDYLAKPFLPRELNARIQAVLRRQPGQVIAGTGPEAISDGSIRFGDCLLDRRRRRLFRRGQDLGISSGEFDLLDVLVQNPQRPLSRDRLIELTRGPLSEIDPRSMDVQVSRLRKLIERDPRRPIHLQTVWGYGYVFAPEGSG
jgi:two-component system phosphate regulon response regulator OmpR